MLYNIKKNEKKSKYLQIDILYYEKNRTKVCRHLLCCCFSIYIYIIKNHLILQQQQQPKIKLRACLYFKLLVLRKYEQKSFIIKYCLELDERERENFNWS